MTQDNFSKDNHYVPQSYLRRWQSLPDKVWVYRTLVSHENVPLWTEKSIKGIAYQQHLYTRNISEKESDAIEKWFSQEFESPAEVAINKAVTNQRLISDDWENLVRFFAMQDVRTPARLKEHLNSTVETTSELLKNILEELPSELEAMKASGVNMPSYTSSSDFPLRVTTEIKEGEEFGILKAETAVGRASWLWGIKHLLEKTVKVLHGHRWTIMRPAQGMHWPTSDKPVVRLNYYAEGKYDFGGGWGRKNTELLLPLDPEHLLYTHIGSRPPMRGTRFSVEHTRLIRRLIAEHADRMIFANKEDPEISALTARTVHAELFKYEEEQWRNWSAEQNESEKHLLTK